MQHQKFVPGSPKFRGLGTEEEREGKEWVGMGEEGDKRRGKGWSLEILPVKQCCSTETNFMT